MSRVKFLSILVAGVFLFGVGRVFSAEDQSKLIEGAKKEGKVVYWSSGLTPELVQGIEEGFKKKYGLRDFQVVYSHAITTEQVAKVTQELRARRLTVDIISGAMPEFFYDLLKAGEVMKYDSPEYKYFPMVKGVCAEPGYWVGTTGMVMAITWNPKVIKKNIVTYNDLLDPQFKGIMCSGDPRKSESYLMNYLGLRKILGKDFFTKLAKQDIVWFTRAPDVTNKVTTGEFPVAFMGNSRTAYVDAMEGGEIKVSFPKEGVVILTNPFVILTKAPHPNAAKLLVDYVSSEEGQRLMVEKSGYLILREGVPIPPKGRDFIPSISKINVIPIDWKSLTSDEVEKTRKEFIEVFGTK
jgi:iron(III) transport system substrate-binding protein